MLYMLALNINDVINFDYMDRPSLEVSDMTGDDVIVNNNIVVNG